MKIFLNLFLICILLSFPFVSYAKGIVPCGGPDEDPCNICYLISGVRDLINWGLGILITVALLAIFISGVMYLVSTGDPGMMESAKNFMKSALIGTVVFLAAWLIVNLVITWILPGNISRVTGKLNWFEIDCTVTDPNAGSDVYDDIIEDD